MKNVRVIARLDIKGPNLVKGVHLEGLRVLGRPEQFARYYYESGADELLYMDIVASLYNRNSLQDVITRTARETFIPLTVGGGLRTIDDMRQTLRAGADKIALNTAAIKNPNIISEAARTFGSSTIVISIEAIRQSDGSYLVYTDNGREHKGIEALEWAKKAEMLGAGEILLTSVDREGTGKGYDIELTKMVTDSLSIPVIACGGPSSVEHIREVIEAGGADAVAVASMLHYDFIKRHRGDADYRPDEGNVDFLMKKGDHLDGIKTASLSEIKDYLFNHKIDCRHGVVEEALK